jgi:hypothetical protein
MCSVVRVFKFEKGFERVPDRGKGTRERKGYQREAMEEDTDEKVVMELV